MKNTAAGVNKFDEMIPAIQKNSDCLRDLGLKLLAHKGNFGTKKSSNEVVQLLRKKFYSKVQKMRSFPTKLDCRTQ